MPPDISNDTIKPNEVDTHNEEDDEIEESMKSRRVTKAEAILHLNKNSIVQVKEHKLCMKCFVENLKTSNV